MEIKKTDISASEFKMRNIEPSPFKVIDVREQLEFQTYNLGGINIQLGILLRNLRVDFLCNVGMKAVGCTTTSPPKTRFHLLLNWHD